MVRSNTDVITVEGKINTDHPFEVALHETLRKFEGKQNTERTRSAMLQTLTAVVRAYESTFPPSFPKFSFVVEGHEQVLHAILVAFGTPIFKHECEKCRYLGTTEGFDHYYCTQMEMFPTVIARFGNHGSCYASGMRLAEELRIEVGMPPDARALRISWLLAKREGLTR